MLVAPGVDFACCFFGVPRAGGCLVVLSLLHPRSGDGLFLRGRAREDRHRVVDVARPRRLSSRLRARSCTTIEAHGARRPPPSRQPTVRDDAGAPALHERHDRQAQGRAHHATATWPCRRSCCATRGAGRASDALLHVLPLHHLHGLGISSLLGRRRRRRDALHPRVRRRARCGTRMAAATVFMGVPTIHHRLLAALDDAADEPTRARWTPSARRRSGSATSGSAALPVTLGERWRALAGAYPLERFGMTEIGVGMSNPLAPGGAPPRHGAARRCRRSRRASSTTTGATPRGRALDCAAPASSRATDGATEATRGGLRREDGGRRWFKTGDTVAARRRRLRDDPRPDERRYPQERRLQAQRPRD